MPWCSNVEIPNRALKINGRVLFEVKWRSVTGNDTGFIRLLDPRCWKHVSLPVVTCRSVSCCKPDMGSGTGETVAAYALSISR